MGYQVQLERFTGPLDLLLHLIEKDELDLYEIPLARITEEYISYIDTLEKLDLENISEFIAIAVHLLEIKAALLFPDDKKKNEKGDGSPDHDDLKEQLVSRLIEYRKFKNAAQLLATWEEMGKRIYTRPRLRQIEETEFVILGETPVNELTRRLQKILQRKRMNTPITRTIVLEQYTVPERMEQIMDMLSVSSEMKEFESFFEHDRNKLSVITTFLAILELIRIGEVEFQQESSFQPIWLRKSGQKEVG